MCLWRTRRNNAVWEVPLNGSAYGTPFAVGSGISTPAGFAADANDNLFVADVTDMSIREIPYSGGTYHTSITVGPGLGDLISVTVTPNGNVIAAQSTSAGLKEVPFSGGAYLTPGPLSDRFGNPIDLYGGAPCLAMDVENVLDTDFLALRGAGGPLRVVGNLPYNISTPLLFRLLAQRAAISDMYFMLQKEVVVRMAAQPGSKDYGRLTVMLAAVAEVESLFDVGPGAFQPRPKVWSAIVRLRPTAGPRFDMGCDGALRALATAAFSHRRKTLRNSLKGLLTSQDIESCGIDPQLRPETLAPAQFGPL